MKVALIAIAKNEDNYLKEWVDYHLKILFDKIIIYQNNWRYNRNDLDENHVELRVIDGLKCQGLAYLNFIDSDYDKYDFGCFWDIDEFFVDKSDRWNIHEILNDYMQYDAIGIPRVFFGSNGLECVKDNNYQVIDRFTKSQVGYDNLIKPIINFKRMKSNVSINNPHIATTRNHIPLKCICPNKTKYTMNGNIYDLDDLPFHLNHYIVKTLEEKIERMKAGDAFFGDDYKQNLSIYRIKHDLDEINLTINAIDNLYAFIFKNRELYT